jgi:hypothetical protein
VTQYPKSGFGVGEHTPAPTGAFPSGLHAQSDPATGDLYIDEGSEITRYDSEAHSIESFGEGLSSSRGVAINKTTKHVYATNPSSGVIQDYELFTPPIPPYLPIDNPAVVHASREAGVHRYGDFQVSPNGRFAIFATREPLDEGYNNNNRYEVYRFDVEPPTGPALSCVSCILTGAAPERDSFLPAHGLGLLDDGRVFFNSNEQLVLRDQNHLQDAYEWKQGTVRLISTGVSPYDSGLLSVSRDGKDAFFFTREQLVSEDENLLSTRVYDAREDGGVFVVPSTPPCAASDECHGPGTVSSPPPPIGTYEGTGGQVVTKKQRRCRKGFHRRKVRGKTRCVRNRRQHKRRRHHKLRATKLGTGGNQ